MGIYLNSESAYTLYKSETQKPYFVDKSRMIEELFPLIEEGGEPHLYYTSAQVRENCNSKYDFSFFLKGKRSIRYL